MYKTLIALFLFTMLFVLSACLHDDNGDEHSPPKTFDPNYTPARIEGTWQQVSDPESVGWSSDRLFAAYEYAHSIDTAAVMIIYQGEVLYHWGEVYRKLPVHSVRKSFMSALYGIAVNNGQINLDSTLQELGIDDQPSALSATEKTASVQMLLQSRSGIYIPAACEVPNVNRPVRYSHDPGTFWFYNNWDFNTLHTIFQQATGYDFYNALNDQLAVFIGMEDYQPTDGRLEYSSSTQHPCYPVNMSARDLARFGQLYLQNGAWEGQQIITQEWIQDSIFPYSETSTTSGYGYMWWVGNSGSFSARGYRGHFIVVIPDSDLVVVHRVNTLYDADNVTGDQFLKLLDLILAAKM